MKYWALLVAFLYFLLLTGLTWPVGYVAFYKSAYLNINDIYHTWIYWAVLAVMLVSQIALLVVPVNTANRRPHTRNSLVWPMVVFGLMAALLFLGFAYSCYEFIHREFSQTKWSWGIWVVCVFFWIFWAAVFFRINRGKDAQDVVTKQCRYLLVGSILELLIAVPTHLVARHRDYCCAGVMTFLGLATGLSVMLFSFGPGIFFLFVDRYQRLRPASPMMKTLDNAAGKDVDAE